MRQKRIFLYIFMMLAGAALLLTSFSHHSEADITQTAKPVVVLSMKGAVGPALSGYLAKGIDKAERENAALLVVELDTPGGLLTTTRTMAQDIIDSPVPIAVYVTPAGAHAASAGTFITYAAHVAAMAEGTNIGAATPIQMQGSLKGQIDTPVDQNADPNKDAENTEKTTEDLLKDALKNLSENDANKKAAEQKAIEDTSAFIRSLANLRGRNAEWAVKAVTEASAITAKEALEQNVIDYVANSRESLLKQAHGKTVKMAGDKTQTIQTENAPIIEFPPDWKTKLLIMITDPNLALIFMSIGVYGLILEFYNPGTMIPGVIGAVSLTVGLYAMNVLPINAAGVILVMLGFVFMLAELFVPSFGILGFGGFAAFMIGITIMFETESMPGLALDMGVIWGVGAVGLLIVGGSIWLAYYSM